MFTLNDSNKYIVKIVIVLFCLLTGFYLAKFYQPSGKTFRIYQQALKDYDNGNYSNSYYLFSKIGYASKLKPFALYHQALCAKALGDEKSELKSYQILFHRFPTNKLSTEATYQTAQLLFDTDPDLAQRYFNTVANSNINSDYKIASKYYIARIEASKSRYSNRKLSHSKKMKIDESFRQYLQKAPNGRLALGAANSWKKFNPKLKSSDYTLIARAYYYAKLYNEAEKIFQKTKISDSWAVQASTYYEKGNYDKVKSLVEEGVKKYSKFANSKDYKNAVNYYIKINDNSYNAASKLFSLAKGNGKDYIWNLKCDNAPEKEKPVCYNSLYSNYPDGEYAQNAMRNIFLQQIYNKNYPEAKRVGQDYLVRFSKSDDVPMVMFWLGKIEQRNHNSSAYIEDYQNIINRYPDSYYAYRAFWILKDLPESTVFATLDIKPVVYPYKQPVPGNILSDLLKVKDYDMVVKYTGDDFIKSWVEYQKGNYSTSMLIAKEAMDKLEQKPAKTDLRWRLVYPLNYYKQVKKYSSQYKNNDALIMAIVREESYFRYDAQSGVGAIGLMQIMPATAHEIGVKNGIEFNTSDLFNPELNLKIGNLYYSALREMLNNKDISAIAAYNGGIGSVTNWKTNLKYIDTDEFVEQIPYNETKNYVKKVFRSYWNYARIYQKQ